MSALDPPLQSAASPASEPLNSAIRGVLVGIVVAASAAFAIAQTAAAANRAGGSHTLRHAAPRALGDAAVQATAGVAAALLVHRFAPRLGLWVVLAIVLGAVYPAAMGGHVRGWAWIPFMLLLTLAALHSIPPALHDAAAVDRAQGWFKFRTITVPLIAPLLLLGLVFRAADEFRPADARSFIAAHLLLGLAIVIGALTTRGRR